MDFDRVLEDIRRGQMVVVVDDRAAIEALPADLRAGLTFTLEFAGDGSAQTAWRNAVAAAPPMSVPDVPCPPASP